MHFWQSVGLGMPERKQTKYLTGGKHSNAEPRPNSRSLAEIPRIGLAHSIPDDFVDVAVRIFSAFKCWGL